ncbi:MAG: phosphoserine phosphatase [Candidatus Thermoplasmatota archaeon]|nr:phosphoserine phosphatase [Candidatus Thermoplasmatota archaeon]
MDLEEIQKKREKENSDAEKWRRVRDEHNREAKRWVDKRDALNAQSRKNIDEAHQHRTKRDDHNQKVREHKEERDKWNKITSEKGNELMLVKKKKLPQQGKVSSSKLKRELKELEKKQMTSVLNIKDERKLVDRMKAIKEEIDSIENALVEDDEIKTLVAELDEARDKAEFHHLQVETAAQLAQEEHDIMIQLYEKGHSLRKEADEAQENFIKEKLEADEAHKNHIEHLRQVHDFDKILFGMRKKAREDKMEAEEEKAKKTSEEILDKFKKGGKLSTEDLLSLQKGGQV